MIRVLLLLTPALAGCVPQLGDTPWLVEAPRLLGVRADRAEAGPGEVISFEALIATPDGAPPVPEWAFCVAPRSLVERGAVSARCVDDTSALVPTHSSSATIPLQACAFFGPVSPPGAAGEAPRRPADPDPTGGFYQPVRISTPQLGLLGFGLERLRCPLANAPAEATVAYAAAYRRNQHPVIDAVLVGSMVAGELETVTAGDTIELSVRLAGGAAEQYAWYDPDRREVVDRQESIDVSWHASAGEFDAARTLGSNRWTATDAGVARFWVVVRDDRGGVAWRDFTLTVRGAE